VAGGDERKPVRGRPPKDASAPRGPDDVVNALIDAATELFANRGIVAVSVREVAAGAGVNVGLVHRYVGTKDDLVRAVIHRAGARLGADLDGMSDPTYADSSEETIADYQRILAHLVLEGHDVETMDLDFPLMRFVIERISAETGVDDREARMRAMCLIALDIGWRLFEPLVTAAAGLGPEDHDAVGAAVDQTRARIGEGV
jgi:TetR/AcrR family transcriptional regulator, repressor for neighboring sulfatase